MKNYFISLLVLGLLSACSSKTGDDPKAEASVKIDVEETKDSLEKSLNNAGREIEKTAAKAKDKLEDAGEAVADKLEEAKNKLSDQDKAKIQVEVKKD